MERGLALADVVLEFGSEGGPSASRLFNAESIQRLRLVRTNIVENLKSLRRAAAEASSGVFADCFSLLDDTNKK